MVEAIFETLVSFFCPTSESASACRDFIQNHSDVLPPLGPLFYFLLFPAVFTILFIYILSSAILPGGRLTKGMQLLIGVSVFIFIIISGWYPIFLVLSEFWFIAIILLFGVWYFLSKHRGGGGNSGGGKIGGLPGLGGGLGYQLAKRGAVEITGQRKRLERELELKFQDLESIKHKIKSGEENAWRAYSDTRNGCWDIIKEYRDLVMVYNVPVGGGYQKKIAEMEKILNELDRKKPRGS